MKEKKRDKIAIIDHGIGNIGSIKKVLEFLELDYTVIASANDYELASGISGFILPGVGSFDVGMKSIRSRKLDIVVDDLVNLKIPGLAICLGMQMLCTDSEEGDRSQEGLNYFDAHVKLLDKASSFVPSIGWNNTTRIDNQYSDRNKMYEGDFYYLHSYSVHAKDKKDVVAQYSHGNNLITAVIQKDNLVGVQFHPEKSQYSGLTLIHDYFCKD